MDLPLSNLMIIEMQMMQFMNSMEKNYLEKGLLLNMPEVLHDVNEVIWELDLEGLPGWTGIWMSECMTGMDHQQERNIE